MRENKRGILGVQIKSEKISVWRGLRQKVRGYGDGQTGTERAISEAYDRVDAGAKC